jgi:hypothetical protein
MMMADWVIPREQSQTASRLLMGSACVTLLRSPQRLVGRTHIGTVLIVAGVTTESGVAADVSSSAK